MLKPTDWDVVAANPEFKALMRAKRRFIVPATIAFIVYYFALPILVGYAPAFMATPVIGPVNIAYLFALSQFFVAWLIASSTSAPPPASMNRAAPSSNTWTGTTFNRSGSNA